MEPWKEPKGVNFKEDHKSDRYTNARKSIFVPASRSQLEDDEDNNEFEKKTYLQKSHDEPEENQMQRQNAFLTTESSSDQLKKSSPSPKSPPKTIHIHTHIPSVPMNTFDTEVERDTPDVPEMMTSSDDANPKVNVYKVFDRIS